jgi:hypothetical protein
MTDEPGEDRGNHREGCQGESMAAGTGQGPRKINFALSPPAVSIALKTGKDIEIRKGYWRAESLISRVILVRCPECLEIFSSWYNSPLLLLVRCPFQVFKAGASTGDSRDSRQMDWIGIGREIAFQIP